MNVVVPNSRQRRNLTSTAVPKSRQRSNLMKAAVLNSHLRRNLASAVSAAVDLMSLKEVGIFSVNLRAFC